VEGARRLRRELKAAGADMKNLREPNMAAAGIVAGAATAAAPRRSGALAGTVRGGAGAASATIRAGYARVPYAGPVHWGWPARNITAQPFLTDAAKRTEPQWVDEYFRTLERVLDRIAGGP
jgi:hypothetical protein